MRVGNLVKVVMVGAIALVMAGCGGGGGSSTPPPAVDNSVLASGQNAQGYYGKGVVFGNSIMWGVWTITATIDGVEYNADLVFYSDGRYFTTGDNGYGDYGVSLNGQVLQSSTGEYTPITNTLGNDCYSVSSYYNGDDPYDAKFCRTDSLNTKHIILISYGFPEKLCNSDDLIHPKSGVSNHVVKIYPSDTTCADFDTSNSFCTETDMGLDYSIACVQEFDAEVTDAINVDNQDIASGNFFGVGSFQ